ncbi:15678_t:CDS:2, partial [Gigaspora margarita]
NTLQETLASYWKNKWNEFNKLDFDDPFNDKKKLAMSNISLLEILSVRVDDVIKGASLNEIKSYFKNLIKPIFLKHLMPATRTKQEVITDKEWPAFTKCFIIYK